MVFILCDREYVVDNVVHHVSLMRVCVCVCVGLYYVFLLCWTV